MVSNSIYMELESANWGCYQLQFNSVLYKYTSNIEKCLLQEQKGAATTVVPDSKRRVSAISPPPRSSRHGTTELLFLGPAWHVKRGLYFFDGKNLPNVTSKSKLLFWKSFKLLKEWLFKLKQTFKSQHCNYILSITIKCVRKYLSNKTHTHYFCLA